MQRVPARVHDLAQTRLPGAERRPAGRFPPVLAEVSQSDARTAGSVPLQRWIVAALAPLAVLLAGCFTSEVPLVDGTNAEYPFTSLSIRTEVGDTATLVREGDHYVFAGEMDEGFDIYFDDFGGGLYLMRFASVAEDGTLQSLYAVVMLDRSAGTVSVYRSIVRDEDFAAGIRHCVQDGVELLLACLDDAAPLIAIVRAAIAAGEAPEDIYAISAMD